MENLWHSYFFFWKWDSSIIFLNHLSTQESKISSVLLSIACDRIRFIAPGIRAAGSWRKPGKGGSGWCYKLWLSCPPPAQTPSVCAATQTHTQWPNTRCRSQYNGLSGHSRPTQVDVCCSVLDAMFYLGCISWAHWGDLWWMATDLPFFTLPRAEGGAAHFGDSAVLDWIKLIMKPHPYTAMSV